MTVMQTMYKPVRTCYFRTLLIIGAMSGILSACQSVPVQPSVAECNCPPADEICPSNDRTQADNSTADTPAPSSDPSVTAPSSTPSPAQSTPTPTATEPAKAQPPTANAPATAQPGSTQRGAAARPGTARKPAPSVIDEKPIIGRVEYVAIESDNMRVKARIDTGAGFTSLSAQNLVSFERDGKPWVRFSLPKPDSEEEQVYEKPVKRYIDIKQLNGEQQNRPVIEMTVTLGPIKEQIDVTLTDRNGYVYPMLIGRNFLMDRAIVDVSRKFSIRSI